MRRYKTFVTLIVVLMLLGCNNPFKSREDNLFENIKANQQKYDKIIQEAAEEQKPIAKSIIEDLKELNILNHKKANEVIATYFPKMKRFPDKDVKNVKSVPETKPAVVNTTGK